MIDVLVVKALQRTRVQLSSSEGLRLAPTGQAPASLKDLVYKGSMLGEAMSWGQGLALFAIWR